MSSEAQAGTAAPAPENSDKAGQAKPDATDSGLNAQQKQEWMTLKQKAEEFNKLEAEKKALEARLAQMERLAVGQGAGQATDPLTEDLNALREQAAYDPMARELLRTKAEAIQARAEVWLTKEVAKAKVPESKREQVEEYVRSKFYQVSVDEALRQVTDPDYMALSARAKELEAENAKLKERSVQPHGSSPATTPPASEQASPDQEEIVPWSEAQATLKGGGQRAKDLRDKMDGRKVRIDYAR
jgi:hypothetical protein